MKTEINFKDVSEELRTKRMLMASRKAKIDVELMVKIAFISFNAFACFVGWLTIIGVITRFFLRS